MPKRYRLVCDDDSNWYCIEADQAEAFEKWLAALASHAVGPRLSFHDRRLDGPLSAVTFEKPEIP